MHTYICTAWLVSSATFVEKFYDGYPVRVDSPPEPFPICHLEISVPIQEATQAASAEPPQEASAVPISSHPCSLLCFSGLSVASQAPTVTCQLSPTIYIPWFLTAIGNTGASTTLKVDIIVLFSLYGPYMTASSTRPIGKPTPTSPPKKDILTHLSTRDPISPSHVSPSVAMLALLPAVLLVSSGSTSQISAGLWLHQVY